MGREEDGERGRGEDRNIANGKGISTWWDFHRLYKIYSGALILIVKCRCQTKPESSSQQLFWDLVLLQRRFPIQEQSGISMKEVLGIVVLPYSPQTCKDQPLKVFLNIWLQSSS